MENQDQSGSRRGPRGNTSTTREDIIAAAQRLFTDLGYAKASVRKIASESGVDPALIRHYFGDKESLFAVSTMQANKLPDRIKEIILENHEDTARKVTEVYLSFWEEEPMKGILTSLVKAVSSSDEVREYARESLTGVISNDIELPPNVIAALSHLFGIAFMRHIICLPPISSMSLKDLINLVTPAIKTYLSGSLDK